MSRVRVWGLRLLLLAQVVGAICVIAPRALPLWEARWVQDDAYVSFRYAKNLVRGDGLVYNPGARVEGYSNFLWTMLSAVPLALGVEDPLPSMHGLGLWFWVCSYALLIALGARLFFAGNWAAPLAAVPLAYHWSYNMWFVSGMETPLMSLFTVALVGLFVKDPEEHPTALLWASLAGVALTLTRPDGVVIFAGIAVAGLAFYWRPLFYERKWWTYFWLPLLPVVLILVPYNVWRVLYFGEFLPNTYYAKVGYLTHYPRGWVYLRGYLEVYPFAAFGPLAVAGAIFAPRGVVRRFLWAALLTTTCAFFYVVRLGGDFMEWRFVTPVTGVLYPAIVIGAGVCAERLWSFATTRLFRRLPQLTAPSWARAAGLAAGLCAVVALTKATDAATPIAKDAIVPGQENIALLSRYWDPRQHNWAAAGKAFNEVLPPGVRIATSSAGIIPFFCDRPCLDLCGLTDPEIARGPVNEHDRGRMGHEHCTEDYFHSLSRGVDIYLHWVDPRDFPLALVNQVPDDMEMVSVRLPDGRYTEFVVLKKERVDVKALRQNPRLVFRDSEPVAELGAFHTLREQYRDYTVVDSLDLEDGGSQDAHELRNVEAGHNWHTKMMRYREPYKHLLVFDGGFHVHDVHWKVRNVSAGRPLVMIVRVDRIGRGLYTLEVNGRALATTLEFPEGEEAWDERAFEIPAEFLVAGTNEFHLRLSPGQERTTEMYYMWFLQPSEASDLRPQASVSEATSPPANHLPKSEA